MAKLLIFKSTISFQGRYNGRNFHHVEGINKVKTIKRKNWNKEDGTFYSEITDIYKVNEGQEFTVYNYFDEWFGENTMSGNYKLKFKIENSKVIPVEIYDYNLIKEEGLADIDDSPYEYTREIIDWKNQCYSSYRRLRNGEEIKTELSGNKAKEKIYEKINSFNFGFDLKDNTEEVLKKLIG